MENNLTNCPVCPNHYPINRLGCGRGRMFFESQTNKSSATRETLHNTDVRPQSELGILLTKCGHYLHHGGDENVLFGTLSCQEKETLKLLLKKVTETID